MEGRADRAWRLQSWILLVLELGIVAGFAVLAVRKFVDGEAGKGAVCLAGVAYVGFRSYQVGRSLLRQP